MLYYSFLCHSLEDGKTGGLMVNSCANTMWLIRQAIPPGVLEKEQGRGLGIRKRDG